MTLHIARDMQQMHSIKEKNVIEAHNRFLP